MTETVSFQGQQVIRITSGDSEILLAPQAGGRLLRWTIGGREVIHWPEDADWSKPPKVRGGNPLLFPFIARHYVDGELGKWKDRDGTIRDLPMHGFARDLPFIIDATTDDSISMLLVPGSKTESGYPFAFEFRVAYRIEGRRLECTLDIRNTGDQSLPYYTGHHFYFALPASERPSWTLQMDASKQSVQSPEGAIQDVLFLPYPLRLDIPEAVDRFHLCASQSDVELRNADGRSLLIQLDAGGNVPWCAVTTWTLEPTSDFYCVEPWTGLPNAIHHGQGLRWVAPGTAEMARCVIDASNW